ncbi:MAG: hypothetical protein ICV64_00970 [Thermoleophilia bacterium]|nr:hypothetical protein [Thermoleophilia bacterium]
MARPVTRVEFEPEEEVDLSRYASALAARWWLALLGLVAGALVGYALALGGSDVYRAQALVDLGSPQAPGASGTVQSPGSLVTRSREIARSERVVRQVAGEVGIAPGRLRSGLSVQPVTQTGRAAATSLLGITVTGGSPRRVSRAANVLATAVVERASPYVEDKIRLMREQIAAEREQLELAERQIRAALAVADDPGSSPSERLLAVSQAGIYEQRRAAARDNIFRRRTELALAEHVEQPRLVDRATAVKTTARSPRNSAVVGAVIGLLLGIVAALAWDPVAGAVRRRA